MASKPIVRRTYGKLPPRTSSSSSLFDDLPPSSPPSSSKYPSSFRSSSPPSSSRLETPIPSSPPTPVRPLFSAPSSPLFFPVDYDEDEDNQDENSIPCLEEKSSGPMALNGGVKGVKKSKTPMKKAVQSSLKGFFAPVPTQKSGKRPLEPTTTLLASSSRYKSSSSKKPLVKISIGGSSAQKLTQMHLTHLPLLHTCQECGMSYMRGGIDDSVHITHHSRVLKGIVWDGLGKGKGKGRAGSVSALASGPENDLGWKVVKDDIAFAGGRGRGKVIMVDGSWGGTKLDEILSTVDTIISSPPLPTPILDRCKIFIFVTASSPPPPRPTFSGSTSKRQRLDPASVKRGAQKERIVSVVVAQGIKWAMRVLEDGERCGGAGVQVGASGDEVFAKKEGVDGGNNESGSKGIESGGLGSVTCDPKPLPTPLGIHRLYTSPSYRSHGLSYHLLNAACGHTVYGCSLDPSKGEVAFSQPTESGREVMFRWGKGGIRVFVEDESQL